MVLTLAGTLSSACDTGSTVAPLPVAPAASTPVGAVQQLAWAFEHRDSEVLARLLSDDFEFQRAELDSAGNSAPDSVMTRESMLMTLRVLLEGGPGIPAPASVHLFLDPNLIPFDDTRAGKNPKWHRTIRTSVDLVVVDSTSQHEFEASGRGLFYLTRGDSAAIPADEVVRGAHADSTQWWISRWEDETIGTGGAHVNLAMRTSAWAILRFYRDRVRR